MTPQQEQTIKTLIERHAEVHEALEARRGELFALQVTTFVACSKMFNRMYQPSKEGHREFCLDLLKCMGYTTPPELHDFLTEVQLIEKAQEIKL